MGACLRAWSVVALCAVATGAHAADVPVGTGLLVMLKVLTYDAHFAARGSGEFVVLVPYAPEGASGAEALLAAAKATGISRILDRPLRFSAVPAAELEVQARALKASAILVPGASGGEVVKGAARVAAASKLYTLSLDEAQVKQGLLLGVTTNAGKPQVVINSTVARGLGVTFSASVLKIAKMYQ